MDYGYTEAYRYEVRIADRNKKLIGSGVLFAPDEDRFAYVFTAAHLFWYTDDSNKKHEPSEINLSLTYAAHREGSTDMKISIHQVSDRGEYEDNIILLHPKYSLGERNSKWDAAILRIYREPWMDEKVKAFSFPSAYEDEFLFGWGYPETMSETEGHDSDITDSFRESLPLEGSAKKYDEKYQEILFQYVDERSGRDLDGLSGTGLYGKPDLFFGVLSRDAGNEYSGSYTWITAWKAFEEILDAYGNIEYAQYVRSLNRVDLNLLVWWLPESTAYYGDGLMDDRYSINLQALLMGMTDSYTVVLASVWNGGIGRGFKNHQQWFEYDEYFPEHKINLDQTHGIVVNLCSDEKKPYEIIQRVSDILRLREENATKCKLIVNIYSFEPRSAFDALYKVWEMKGNEKSIDFLSAISYSMLAEQMNDAALEEVSQIKDRLERLDFPEMTRELITYRDVKTAVWWKVLKDIIEFGNQDDVLVAFQAAKSYRPAIEYWINGLKVKWLAEWREHPEELICKLESEDIDLLCWELYLYQKKCKQDKVVRYRDLLYRLLDYSTESVKNLLETLLSNEVIHVENGFVQPRDVARWARTAEQEEFERNIASLKIGKTYYWSAILNSIYGLQYVMNEIQNQRQSIYLGEILNQNVSNIKDICQKEDIEYKRSIIRRRRKK